MDKISKNIISEHLKTVFYNEGDLELLEKNIKAELVAAYNRAIEDVEAKSYLSECVLNEEQQMERIVEVREIDRLRIL